MVLSPNRGAVVRDFSPREIEDLYYVRSVLERAVAPLIVERIGPAALRELRTLNQRFEEACRRREMAAMIWTNIAFHRRMSAVSGNAFLCQLLDFSRLQTNQIPRPLAPGPQVLALRWTGGQRVRRPEPRLLLRGHGSLGEKKDRTEPFFLVTHLPPRTL